MFNYDRIGSITFCDVQAIVSKWMRLHDKHWMTAQPSTQSSRHLSDGSLATDPWPGIDLHLIRSAPEVSLIGGPYEEEEEPRREGEKKERNKGKWREGRNPIRDKAIATQKSWGLMLLHVDQKRTVITIDSTDSISHMQNKNCHWHKCSKKISL